MILRSLIRQSNLHLCMNFARVDMEEHRSSMLDFVD